MRLSKLRAQGLEGRLQRGLTLLQLRLQSRVLLIGQLLAKRGEGVHLLLRELDLLLV